MSSRLLVHFVVVVKDEYKERAVNISIKSERKGPLPYNTATLKRANRPPPSLSSLSLSLAICLCLSLFLSHGQPNRNDVFLSPPAIDLTKPETEVICGRKRVLVGSTWKTSSARPLYALIVYLLTTDLRGGKQLQAQVGSVLLFHGFSVSGYLPSLDIRRYPLDIHPLRTRAYFTPFFA